MDDAYSDLLLCICWGVVWRFVTKKDNLSFIMAMLGIMAVLSGALRHITKKPFPTAFPLLIMTAFLGITLYFHDNGQDNRLALNTGIFEISLLTGAYLSYSNWWAYILAYNLGLFLFITATRIGFDLLILKKLGDIGFTFFLGAYLVYTILERFGKPLLRKMNDAYIK